MIKVQIILSMSVSFIQLRNNTHIHAILISKAVFIKEGEFEIRKERNISQATQNHKCLDIEHSRGKNEI